MNVTSNGIKLSICHFNDYQRNSVGSEDGADYCMTHYLIDVTCVFNFSPGATASFGGNPVNPPPNTPGDTAPTSIAALEHALMQKRRPLVVDIGGTVILQSPAVFPGPGGTIISGICDANNGPNPLSFNVVSFLGSKSIIVRYRIETWLNRNQAEEPPLIVSNRWTQSEDFDISYRSTLHVEGQVVFRPDGLQFLNKRADAFRGSFVLPVPNGYQRTNLQVRASSDGCHVGYSFDDEQPEGGYQILPGSPIVKAHGKTSWGIDYPSLDSFKLPMGRLRLECEVWGSNLATRSSLADAVVRILASVPGALGRRVAAGKAAGINAQLSVDFPSRHASASVEFVTNGIGAQASLLFKSESLLQAQNIEQFKDFSVANIWTQGVGQAPVPNVAPPFGGTRSSAEIALVVQSLLAPDATPSNVPPSLYIW